MCLQVTRHRYNGVSGFVTGKRLKQVTGERPGWRAGERSEGRETKRRERRETKGEAMPDFLLVEMQRQRLEETERTARSGGRRFQWLRQVREARQSRRGQPSR